MTTTFTDEQVMQIEAIRHALGITSDHDFRKWPEIRDALTAAVQVGNPEASLSEPRPKRALQWAVSTFGKIALDKTERAARLVEEAIELAQTQGLPIDTVKKIADRVGANMHGRAAKEIGQVGMTLECLAENLGLDVSMETQREFLRVSTISKEEWQRRHDAKAAIGIASPCGDTPTLPLEAERAEPPLPVDNGAANCIGFCYWQICNSSFSGSLTDVGFTFIHDLEKSGYRIVKVASESLRGQGQASPVPQSAHWLGDREQADQTQHAMDVRGCVLFFERQSDCLEFMRRLDPCAQAESEVMPCDGGQPNNSSIPIRNNPPGPAPATPGRADEGWQLVPKVPDEAMRRAGIDASPMFPLWEIRAKSGRTSLDTEQCASIYQAMCAKAPSPPAQSVEGHTRSCPALTPGDGPCTCALEERIYLRTEQAMHAAWRKRAEEAEARIATLTQALADVHSSYCSARAKWDLAVSRAEKAEASFKRVPAHARLGHRTRGSE